MDEIELGKLYDSVKDTCRLYELCVNNGWWRLALRTALQMDMINEILKEHGHETYRINDDNHREKIQLLAATSKF